MIAATTTQFFTMDALIERWGVTRETIMAHVNEGRLGFVDLSPGGVKKGRKGFRQIGFSAAHVADFEANRSVRWAADEAPKPLVVPTPNWDGKVRTRPITSPPRGR